MNDAGILSSVFVAVFAAYYIMFIRPIHKEQSRHRQEIRDLRIGDEVLTTSNFIATIKDIQVPMSGPTRISIELADGVVFTAMAGAILQRLTPAEGKDERPSEQKDAPA